MLNLNSVLVVFFIFLSTHLFNTLKEKDAEVRSQVTDSLFSTTFLLYADSLSTFKKIILRIPVRSIRIKGSERDFVII